MYAPALCVYKKKLQLLTCVLVGVGALLVVESILDRFNLIQNTQYVKLCPLTYVT